MTARITGEALQALTDLIAPLDTEEARTAYRNGDFPRAHLVVDLDKRYRWDLFCAVKGWNVLGESYNDSHIDTALRSIVKAL